MESCSARGMHGAMTNGRDKDLRQRQEDRRGAEGRRGSRVKRCELGAYRKADKSARKERGEEEEKKRKERKKNR